MEISLKEINYNLSILEQTLDSPRAKELDIGFIEIFANDIQNLQTKHDERSIKEVSHRLETIAARIYDISGKSLFASDEGRPKIRPEQPIATLADTYSEGHAKTGLTLLAPHFTMIPVAGDGHCLFRSIAAGVLHWIQKALNEEQDRFFVQLDKEVQALSSPELQRQYGELQMIIFDLSKKQRTVAEVLSEEDSSDQLVAFLRTLAAAYNRKHQSETFEAECVSQAGSKEAYLAGMTDMALRKMGGEPEYIALGKALGFSIVVFDAVQLGKNALTVQPQLDALKASSPPAIALLYRPGHYDLLKTKTGA